MRKLLLSQFPLFILALLMGSFMYSYGRYPAVHSEEREIDSSNYIFYKEKVNSSDPVDRWDVIGHLVAWCRPEWTWVWSCDSMIRYFIAENYTLLYTRINTNIDGSKDYGICQINQFSHRYTEMRNGESIRTWRRKDSLDQIEYCLWVRQNLRERKMHPWKRFYAYKW